MQQFQKRVKKICAVIQLRAKPHLCQRHSHPALHIGNRVGMGYKRLRCHHPPLLPFARKWMRATSAAPIRPAKNPACRLASLTDGLAPPPHRPLGRQGKAKRLLTLAQDTGHGRLVALPPSPRQVPPDGPRQTGLVIAQTGRQMRALHQHHLGPDEVPPPDPFQPCRGVWKSAGRAFKRTSSVRQRSCASNAQLTDRPADGWGHIRPEDTLGTSPSRGVPS